MPQIAWTNRLGAHPSQCPGRSSLHGQVSSPRIAKKGASSPSLTDLEGGCAHTAALGTHPIRLCVTSNLVSARRIVQIYFGGSTFCDPVVSQTK
jgi:hypothetical protein